MSLETEIREAFERHANETRPQTGTWRSIERRIVRGHRLRILAATAGTAAAVIAAAVITPRALTRNEELVRPRPIDMSGWKIFEDKDDGYTLRHPATWTSQRAEHSDLVVVLPNDFARDGGKPEFSLDLAVELGAFNRFQAPPNFKSSTGTIGDRYSYMRTETRVPASNVSVRYWIDWTAPGCVPGAQRCLAQTLVASLSATTPQIWERYGATAQQIVSTIRAISLDDSPGPTALADLKLRVIETIRGSKTEVFTGELALDPVRNLLLVGEQHDEGNFEFRVRVVDARTMKTVRYIGPGLLRAVDHTRGLVYLDAGVGTATSGLDVFEIETGAKVASLPADEGTPPALDPTHGLVYVSHSQARSIEVYDVMNGFKLVRTLPVEESIRWMAIDQPGETLYVSWDRVGVSLLDASDGQTIRTISDFDNPTKSAPRLTAGDGWFTADVGNYLASELGMYTSHGALSWEVRLSRAVQSPVVDRDQELLFNAVHDLTDADGGFASPNEAPDLVEVRSFVTGEILGSIRVPDGPVALAIDTSRRHVYVACLLGNAVVMLSY